MHVVIGILTALAGLMWAFLAFQRAGRAFSPVGPFTWYRRVQWQRRFNQKPLYSLKDPVDVAAVLLLGTAKCEGEVSAEQKRELLSIFGQEFQLSPKDASDLLVASAYLLRDEVYILDNLPKILEPAAEAFTPERISSLLALMRRIGTLDSPFNAEQEQLIAATEQYFAQRAPRKGNW
jgi:hypothetical protein